MNRALINFALLVVMGCLVALHWVILPDPSRRNFEFLPDMMFSLAHDAQSPVTLAAAGVPLDLRPPEGTIARGYMPLTYPATPEGALQAGEELHNPFAADDVDAVTRGEEVFNTFCSVCHGVAGQGDGTVAKRGVPPPPSLLLEHALNMTEGQMYHVISLGQGNMASYASQVTRDDRWRAIIHIRRMQAAPPPAPAADPAALDAAGADPATDPSAVEPAAGNHATTAPAESPPPDPAAAAAVTTEGA
jgi:mono/diheme cytochrome c family protein